MSEDEREALAITKALAKARAARDNQSKRERAERAEVSTDEHMRKRSKERSDSQKPQKGALMAQWLAGAAAGPVSV